MTKLQKNTLLFLRLALGWLFLYAGVSKILTPGWSAAGYLAGAKTLPGLYTWFALPQNLIWVNLLNEWGLTLIGLSLILGLWVRWSSFCGVILMILYYLPVLSFPYAGEHSLIVDDHIIYILSLIVLAVFHAGYYWGLDGRNK